jgi:hypothetical protein
MMKYYVDYCKVMNTLIFLRVNISSDSDMNVKSL